jgi:GH15 family glucan-1,4-alpha-glucosidase
VDKIMSNKEVRYPPIADYALISDCHCNALVSRNGSVDWCCMPRVDDDSCFGRLLDWDKGGYFSITPVEEFTSSWRYVPFTMILENEFRTATGKVRLTDFFALGPDGGLHDHAEFDHVRIVDGLEGEVEMCIDVRPRFDYGEILPRMREEQSGVYTASGSDKGLIIHSDVKLEVAEHDKLEGTVRVKAGQRVRFAMEFETPELVRERARKGQASAEKLDAALDATRHWWEQWAQNIRDPYDKDSNTLRSAITLKALTIERTGAIIAATTTSLPEWIGGERNWDYRYSWVRDSVFTVRVLHDLGCVHEADRFHQFTQRSAAGSAEQMQLMYGVSGKRRLTEINLEWLEGYRGSRPVRIGNSAAKQTQLDIYGELLEMAWEWHASGHPTEAEYWTFLADVVDQACAVWQEKDHGIWEVRAKPRHYVHSKVMCWAAVNRGIQLAQENGFDAPIERWSKARDAMRAAIEDQGYDQERGAFVQAFGEKALDAAVLLLPRVSFVAYDDPRMVKTVDAICDELDCKGLLLRYDSEDGLEGREGMFLPCTFWLVVCLVMQGKRERAQAYYDRALACANDLGLFSEEFDSESGQMLGNFPQGLTHVSQIMARLALDDAAQGG